MTDKEKHSRLKLREKLNAMTIDELMMVRGTYVGARKMILADKKFGYEASRYLSEELEKAIQDKEFEAFHNSLADVLNEEDDKIES